MGKMPSTFNLQGNANQNCRDFISLQSEQLSFKNNKLEEWLLCMHKALSSKPSPVKKKKKKERKRKENTSNKC
jgi:hypothetical protein